MHFLECRHSGLTEVLNTYDTLAKLREKYIVQCQNPDTPKTEKAYLVEIELICVQLNWIALVVVYVDVQLLSCLWCDSLQVTCNKLDYYL